MTSKVSESAGHLPRGMEQQPPLHNSPAQTDYPHSSDERLGDDQSIASGPEQHTSQVREELFDSQKGFLATAPRQRSLYFRLVRFSVRLGEWWFPEIASFTIAAGLFALHVYLLRRYDGKPVEDWEDTSLSLLFTTLPSAISFLSTLIRGAMGLPVASAIGQWKWHQYRRQPQPLDKLDRFDKASRGMTGSVVFLLSGSLWNPASLGCVIIIASIFLGPTLQNTIRTEIKPSVLGNLSASMPVAGSFSHHTTRGSESDELHILAASSLVQASIARGWSYGSSREKSGNISTFVFPDCPTNKCRWDNWSSLILKRSCRGAEVITTGPHAFSEVASVSTMRNIDAGNSTDLTTRLKTRLNMSPRGSVPRLSSYIDWPKRHAILAHVGIIGDFYNNGTGAEAVECVLYWGTTRGSSTWLNGTITDEIDEDLTWKVTRPDNVPDNIPDTNETAWKYDNITITADWKCNINTTAPTGDDLEPVDAVHEDSCEYKVTDKAQRGLLNSLLPYISGYGWRAQTSAGQAYLETADTLTHQFFRSWNVERGGVDGPTNEGALLRSASRQMLNLAFFTTAALRRQSGDFSFGTASEDVIYFEARYHHLIIPGVLLTLSVAFFAFAALWTRGEHAWRNSQLPLLYHGLEHTGPREWTAVRMTSMWEAACDARVKMDTDGGDGGLRLRRHRTGLGVDTEYKGYTRVGGAE